MLHQGRSMPLTTFFRIARNTTHMWFKGSSPSATEVEHEFWRHVRDRNFHICVNAGSVDCSDPPYGFPIRNSPFAKHPWNLKVLSNSNGSILRSLGSIIGKLILQVENSVCDLIAPVCMALLLLLPWSTVKFCWCILYRSYCANTPLWYGVHYMLLVSRPSWLTLDRVSAHRGQKDLVWFAFS